MTITAANWSRRVEITDANTSPSLTGYVALLTESNLPAEIWSTAINGGGDLRACLNSDGTSQLPLEVVSFDTVAETAVLWVRFPTFSSGESLWLFYGKAGETQPSVTDTFGRNAVWVEYEAVLHMNEVGTNGVFTDSTGKGYDTSLLTGGALGTTSTSHPFGSDWPDFQASQVLGIIGSGGILNGVSDVTVQNIINPDSSADVRATFGNRVNPPDNQWVQMTASERTFLKTSGSTTTIGSVTTIPLNVNAWMAMQVSASQLSTIIDGVSVQSQTPLDSTLPFSTGSNWQVGAYFDNRTGFRYDGRIAECRVRLETLSVSFLSTEHANQSSPNTFWSTGTPEATGTGTPTIVPTAIASQSSVGSPVVTRLLQELSPTAISSSESVGSPVLGLGLVSILPTAITSGESVGEPTVQSLLKILLPSEILSQLSVGNPLVLGGDSIVIPVGSRATWGATAKYLRELVFTGYDNDVIQKWLISEGYTGSYNDNWNEYLEAEGKQGSLTDKLSQWRGG